MVLFLELGNRSSCRCYNFYDIL